jgi:DNA-binding transcriptional LysR family regulator
VDLRQLQHFLAVVDAGSFSRAAERLGKSQQALSKSVRALEETLGVRLLDRGAKAVSPTAYGQLLVPTARGIERDAQAFRERLEALRRATPARVRLGASPAAVDIAAEAVLRLRSMRPQLQIAVLTGIHPSLAAQLLAGELDAFVCMDNEDEEHPAIASEVLAHDEYRILARAAHPLARVRRVRPEQLHAHPWILGRDLGAVERGWRHAFEHAGGPPPAAIETSSLEFCRRALASSDHLSLLPARLVATDLSTGTLVCLDTDDFRWSRPIALHYRRDEIPSPATLAAIDALHAAAARDGAPRSAG